MPNAEPNSQVRLWDGIQDFLDIKMFESELLSPSNVIISKKENLTQMVVSQVNGVPPVIV